MRGQPSVPALALLLVGATAGGCDLRRAELLPAEAPDAQPWVAPPESVRIEALEASHLDHGQALPGPRLSVVLRFDGRTRATALGVRATCAAGGLTLVDDHLIRLQSQAPPVLVHPLFGGAPLVSLPERCELRIRVEPRPGVGSAPREVAVACGAPGRIAPGACPLPSVGEVPPFGESVAPGPGAKVAAERDSGVAFRDVQWVAPRPDATPGAASGSRPGALAFTLVPDADGALPEIWIEVESPGSAPRRVRVDAPLHPGRGRGARVQVTVPGEGPGPGRPLTVSLHAGERAPERWCATLARAHRGPCPPPPGPRPSGETHKTGSVSPPSPPPAPR